MALSQGDEEYYAHYLDLSIQKATSSLHGAQTRYKRDFDGRLREGRTLKIGEPDILDVNEPDKKTETPFHN